MKTIRTITALTLSFTVLTLVSKAQLQVLSSGNVGVGTTIPQVKLDVVGSNQDGIRSTVTQSADWGYGILSNVNRINSKALAVQQNGVDKFVVYGNGNGWFNGTWLWSDRKLKENIVPLTGSLNKVLQLQGYTYNFLSSVTGESKPPKQMGLIAQDVEAVLPEIVATNENGVKGIAYQNIIALLIEAMKEQNKKITDLDSQLAYCCSNMQESGNGSTAPNTSPTSNTARLLQNNPNPFSQQTTIGYYLPAETRSASLMIFDMQGKLVKTMAVTNFGNASLTINANELSAGMFMYSLIADGKEVDSKRMILTQ